MAEILSMQKREISKLSIKTSLRISLKLFWMVWPLLVVHYGIPRLYVLLKYTVNGKMALNLTYCSHLLILWVPILLHRKGWGKSLPILLISCVYINQGILAVQSLFKKILAYPWLWYEILYAHAGYMAINALLLFGSIKAILYVWSNCEYKEIFAFHKIKDLQNIRIFYLIKYIKNAKTLFNSLNRTVIRSIWKCRQWIFPWWFIPVIYNFWFRKYFFLYPNASLTKFFEYVGVMFIPLIMVFVSLVLYKPCKLMHRFGVMPSIFAHIAAQGYGMLQYAIYYHQHPPISWTSKGFARTFKQMNHFIYNRNSWIFLIDFLLFSAGFYILIKLCMAHLKTEPKAKLAKRSTNYGSAKFLDLKGIKKINHKEGIPIGAVPKISDFIDPHRIIKSIKERGGGEIIRIKASHTTLVAPSRTGKGTGIIIPTLLEYPGPVFVTDVKGENYPVTKRARETKGRKVIAFDPFQITDAPKIRIDLLKILDPTSMEVVEDAQTLSKLLCPDYGHDGTNTQHFRSQAAALIQCLLLYIACAKEISDPDRNLATVYDLLCLTLDEQTQLMQMIGSNHALAYGTPSRIANSIATTHPEERSGIFSTARVEMRFVDTPQIRDAITIPGKRKKNPKKNPSILLSDITKGDIDLFVCIPLEKLSTQHRLLRLITGIVFIEMQKARGCIGKDNLLMVLDEMPALGHMKQIEEMLVYGGGFGISLLTVSQTIEFLQSVYPNTWKTFFSNQLSIFFACSEPMTSKFVAEKLGKKTIEVASINQSIGKQKRSMELTGITSNQASDSASETGRELLMPDEIERLGDRIVLAFDRGTDPIICHRMDYRERSEWVGFWDENPLHANRNLYNQLSFKEYGMRVKSILMS